MPHRSTSPVHRLIRFGVFLFGLILATIVTAKNYQTPAYLFLQLVFGLWLISPNLLFVLGTWRLTSRFSLLGIALLLCSVQLYFAIGYFSTHHATAPIILLISPIPEFGILALGLAIAYLAEYGQSHWHHQPPQAPPHPVAPAQVPEESNGSREKRASGTAGGQRKKPTSRRGRTSVRKKVREKRKTNRPKKGKKRGGAGRR